MAKVNAYVDFDGVSMAGLMCYAVMCAENYALEKLPEYDLTPAFDRLWGIAASSNWEAWRESVIDIMPECLFEFDSYDRYSQGGDITVDEDSFHLFRKLSHGLPDGWGEFLNLLEAAGDGGDKDAVRLGVNDVVAFMEREGVDLPDPKSVAFSSDKGHYGWGDPFDPHGIARIYGMPKGWVFLPGVKPQMKYMPERYFPFVLASERPDEGQRSFELRCEDTGAVAIDYGSGNHGIDEIRVLGCAGFEFHDACMDLEAFPRGGIAVFPEGDIDVPMMRLCVYYDGIEMILSDRKPCRRFRCAQAVFSFDEEGGLAAIHVDDIGKAFHSHIRSELFAQDSPADPTSCPECGKKLYVGIDGSNWMLECPEHGCTLVTTFIPPIWADEVDYSIYLEDGNASSTQAVKAVANLANCNYHQAKSIIEGPGIPCIYSGAATEVVKAMRKLDDAQVNYSVSPPFPFARKGMSMYDWIPFDDGGTIGEKGSEGGEIIADEEFDDSARVTLERCDECCAVTCGIYGAMVHTAFCSKDHPWGVYEAIKQEIGAFMSRETTEEEETEFYDGFTSRW